jgi:DNA segregation ATPase FtsK/SpoIIIE, S-DNA-T family
MARSTGVARKGPVSTRPSRGTAKRSRRKSPTPKTSARRSAVSRGRSRDTSFLPPGAVEFMRRRAFDAVGLGLALVGVFMIAALVSYAPTDPNWNRAASATIANWAGAPGAYISDLALQSMGVGSATVIVVLLAWAWRIALRQGLPHFWGNLLALPIALCLGALFAATWPTPDAWPLKTGLGGFAGDTLVHQITNLFADMRIRVNPLVLAGVSGVAWAGAVWFTLGIDRYQWQAIGRAIITGARVAVFALIDGIQFAARTLAMIWYSDVATRLRRAGPQASRAKTPKPKARARSSKSTPSAPAKPRRGTLIDRAPAATKSSKRAAREAQPTLDLGPDGEYQIPPLGLLNMPDDGELQGNGIDQDALEQNARMLESVLDDFGVRGEIVKVRPGPVVTLYELEPSPGTKSSRVIGLANDIARSMSAVSARVAVIPGRNALGIELPNLTRETVYLGALFSTQDYEGTAEKLPLVLGKDIGGAPIIADLASMPHLLIAGTTGSGKSVAVNAMILSLLFRLSPQECRLIMIDPKMLELSLYDGIPHLLAPVVTEPGKAVVALKWAVNEMESRYRGMSQLGVRNIISYNQRLAAARKKGTVLTRTVQTGFEPETGKPIMEEQALDLDPLPYIVVVVDEMADLMMVAGKDIEGAVQRLAQMARAAGIHLIMATQRPSVDVITGTIKANFPTRISFQVTSKIDSRTILGEQGAEQLLGMGDMLYMSGGGRITRVHGPFVSEDETEAVVAAIKSQGVPDYREDVTEEPEEDGELGETSRSSNDEFYDQAVALVAREGKASTSFVQRHFQIGYNRAARIIEAMEAEGVVSKASRSGKREVLVGDHSG